MIGCIASVLVLTEPVRSAEPPTSSGTAGVNASSTSWLALRVAQVGRSSAKRCLSARRTPSSPVGRSPAWARSNSARASAGWRARRACQAARAGAPRPPKPRHAPSSSGRDLERRIRPAELRARAARHLVGAERRAVGRGGARLVRRAVADRGAAGDQARPVGVLRRGQSGLRSPRDRGRRSRWPRQP